MSTYATIPTSQLKNLRDRCSGLYRMFNYFSIRNDRFRSPTNIRTFTPSIESPQTATYIKNAQLHVMPFNTSRPSSALVSPFNSQGSRPTMITYTPVTTLNYTASAGRCETNIRSLLPFSNHLAAVTIYSYITHNGDQVRPHKSHSPYHRARRQ